MLPRSYGCKTACKPNSVLSNPAVYTLRLRPALSCQVTTIYLVPTLPTGSSGQPGESRASIIPLFGLAPDGVCLASVVTIGAVSSYLTISPWPRPKSRWYVSVALSVGLPRPAVSGHPAQWSSDFPPPSIRKAAVIQPSYIPVYSNILN